MASTTDISNWREPDHCQWAFRNVDKVLKTEIIKASPSPSSFETGPLNLDAFRLTLTDGSVQDFPAFCESTQTDGILIVKDGKIVHEHYDRGYDRDSKHIMMSMSKSICGLLAGILHGRGQLEVDAKISKYVPEVKGSSLENATVRQCLDMRSNVLFDDDTHEYRMASGWNKARGTEEHDNLHDFISTFQAPAPPPITGVEGAPFEYVSVNTDLIGWVLERAAGKGSVAELLSTLLWQPMGAESDAYITVDKAGSARTAGGLCATLRDLARVGQLVVEGGRGVVPKDWIEDLLHGGSQEVFAASNWAPFYDAKFPSATYRSFWLTDRRTEVFMAVGIHGQHLFVDRKNHLVIAKFSSQPEPFEPQKLLDTVDAFLELQRVATS